MCVCFFLFFFVFPVFYIVFCVLMKENDPKIDMSSFFVWYSIFILFIHLFFFFFVWCSHFYWMCTFSDWMSIFSGSFFSNLVVFCDEASTLLCGSKKQWCRSSYITYSIEDTKTLRTVDGWVYRGCTQTKPKTYWASWVNWAKNLSMAMYSLVKARCLQPENMPLLI